MQPPFANSWEQLQERRFENVLIRQQKELPRAFHNALLELSMRTNSDGRFVACSVRLWMASKAWCKIL
ncbi:MAG: hypothetical protein M5U34_29655 [Chloroflexi bacterium]|nr:hypothetical protein [Chloroflexota bacterium]